MKNVSELINLYFKYLDQIKYTEREIETLESSVSSKPTGNRNGVMAGMIDKYRFNVKRLEELKSTLIEKKEKLNECHIDLIEAFELIGRKNIIVTRRDDLGRPFEVYYAIDDKNDIFPVTSV